MAMTLFPYRRMHDESGSGPGRRSQWVGADRMRILAEKERRSVSTRTVQAYTLTLFQFFDALGKSPDEVSSRNVFSYAHSIGLSGRKPSSVTIAARIACLSFYSG